MAAVLRAEDCTSLSDHQLDALRTLEISDQQIEFGGTFAASLMTSLEMSGAHLRGLCFLGDQMPIGMVILKRPPLSPDWVPADAVSIHGLKIGAQWQGKGYGRCAFELAYREAKRIWPSARFLALSVDAANQTALSLYKGFGMIDSGPIHSGRIGVEHHLEMELTAD